MSAANMLSLFKIQYHIIFENPTPIAEVLVTPKGTKFYAEYWGLLPFARGNVHIASTDPLQQPSINPNYMMLGGTCSSRSAQANSSASFQHCSHERTHHWRIHTGIHHSSHWRHRHPVGFLDQLCISRQLPPRRYRSHDASGHGRCRGYQAYVYATANVRVVDASVLPFQVCGHSMSTLYAVSECAADLIKTGNYGALVMQAGQGYI
ncbi:glucose oxidase [Aspergillus udagawae]|uniref:Glucose oxidase n=1 Tax=Aspergillus udagawae TaxID=91492 RepID=A0A8H3NKJ8_9EURO|nr:glucose oxidase [Aspergillus udagawae]